MARTRAAEHSRSRSKELLIEEAVTGINKFEEILTAIHDFSQEGFPYRDAARSKTETQFREYVRQIFGERSPEFQTYRNHKLRISSHSEIAQSVAVVRGLMQVLEDKKLELQGLKPQPTTVPSNEKSPCTSPKEELAPPTAEITIMPQQARTTQSMKVSVAMSSNLGAAAVPAATAEKSTPAQPQSQDSVTPSSMTAEPQAAKSTQHTKPPTTDPVPPQSPAPPAPSALRSNLETGSFVKPLPGENPSPSFAPVPTESNQEDPPSPSGLSNTPPGNHQQASVKADFSSSQSQEPSPPETMIKQQTSPSGSSPDTIQLVRKVCLRFHSVVRQLRLRKDYRPTLEVDDVDDLQDLLWALLKMEFDEVGVDEWSPPYTNGSLRRTFLLDKDQIAFVAKKTQQGLTPRELTDQVRTDSARYAAREKCNTVFCFIYDPEGRIGSPTRLESELTSTGDHCKVEVLVAPK